MTAMPNFRYFSPVERGYFVGLQIDANLSASMNVDHSGKVDDIHLHYRPKGSNGRFVAKTAAVYSLT